MTRRYPPPLFSHNSARSFASAESRPVLKKGAEKDETLKRTRKPKKDKPELPKESALHPPKSAPSKWQIFLKEQILSAKDSSPDGKLHVVAIVKEAAARYKELSAAEMEVLTRQGRQAADKYKREYAAWLKTLTPQEIEVENVFRARQRRLGKTRQMNLKDPNKPKRPMPAYMLFLRQLRWDPATFSSVLEGEASGKTQTILAADKWRGMSPAEKQPFIEQAEKDWAEYEVAIKEYKAKHGIAPTTPI